MSHPPATIVIPVWNQWELTRACLDSLRPTLAVQDKVVVVDNGSADGTPQGLRAYPWLQVITNPTNRGFAVACNQGAAGVTREVVVFLNNDTIVTKHWLDGLLAPFADDGVGATGPRSNFVSGPQLVDDASYSLARAGELRAYARDRRAAHRGETTEVTRLVGFCMAVRRAAFEQVGGFDEQFEVGGYEDDDLCNRLVSAGWRLLITHETFVHHHGHRSFDAAGLDWYAIQEANHAKLRLKRRQEAGQADLLLSACMIVRDEEQDLPACLASIKDVVDEIVVYDTGSTDRTKEIAWGNGAVVLEGFWDDDFGRARNVALGACTGQWVLHIDADEQLQADAGSLRAQLARRGAPDALMVPIDNQLRAGTTGSQTHRAVRLFRRERGQWYGRLHEQVLARPDQPPLKPREAEGVRISHTGYLDEAIHRRDKIERNLRMAEAAVAAGDGDPAGLHLNLARAQVGARKLDDALPNFERAAELARGPATRRAALRAPAEALLAQGRAAEARQWIERLRAASKEQSLTDFLTAQAMIVAGDPAGALAILDTLDEPRDEEGHTPATGALAMARGRVLLDLGEPGRAADELLALVGEHGPLHGTLTQLDQALTGARRSFAEVAGVLAPAGVLTALAELLSLPPERGDELIEALWVAGPDDPKVLAAAIRVAPNLPIQRVLEWSSRIRGAGLDEQCPLVAVACDATKPPDLRVRAGALTAAAFADERGRDAVEMAAPAVQDAHLPGVLRELAHLAPDVLDAFVVGAASDARRALVLAKSMHELGGTDEAVAVLGHGLERPGTSRREALAAADWLAGIGLGEEAESLRAQVESQTGSQANPAPAVQP
jgi:GT2 family glycosyltransferase/tetratricopeptide (TPR) repeat protein